jgi:hypothetical protein
MHKLLAMSEADHIGVVNAQLEPSIDFSTQITALRTAGADQFDAVRLHYLDVLAKRGMAHQGHVKRMLDAKLAQALAAFKERFEQAQCAAKEAIDRAVAQYPHAADDLQRLFIAGNFKGLARFVANLKTSEEGASLGALIRQLEEPPPEKTGGQAVKNAEENTGARFELKTIRRFRNTWSKLSADTQVAQALAQPPKNAGPLNSHMLVLRSLASMREISPDYLNRFISYADTLLRLDQCEKEKPVNAKKPAVAKAAKK